MKIIELSHTTNTADHRRWYRDGVRIGRDTYELLEIMATHTDTFSTRRQRGRRTQFKTIRLP